MLRSFRWPSRPPSRVDASRPCRLGSHPDAVEHPAGHDEADEPDGGHQPAGQPAADGGPLADQQSRAAERVGPQREGPLELEADALVTRGGPAGLRVGGLQHQGGVRLQAFDHPTTPAAAVAPERVALGELLPLVVDPVGVLDLQPEQVLHPGVAVEAAPVGAHLHQPRPHRLWRYRDGDRPGARSTGGGVDRRHRAVPSPPPPRSRPSSAARA